MLFDQTLKSWSEWAQKHIDKFLQKQEIQKDRSQYRKKTRKNSFGVAWRYEYPRARHSSSRPIQTAQPYCPRHQVLLINYNNLFLYCEDCKKKIILREFFKDIPPEEAIRRMKNRFESDH